MSTNTGTLTSVDAVSAAGTCQGDGELTFSITGPFTGRVQLERAVIGNITAWEIVAGPFAGPISSTHPARPHEVYRVRCLSLTSGTIGYSFTTTPSAVVLFNPGPLPTSPAGLTAGTFWNNGGVVTIA